MNTALGHTKIGLIYSFQYLCRYIVCAAESQYIQPRNSSVSICIGPRFEFTTYKIFLLENIISIYRCIMVHDYIHSADV